MISQMNAIQNAARLAMADHRAATQRRPRSPGGNLLGTLAIPMVTIGLLAAAVVTILARLSAPG